MANKLPCEHILRHMVRMLGELDFQPSPDWYICGFGLTETHAQVLEFSMGNIPKLSYHGDGHTRVHIIFTFSAGHGRTPRKDEHCCLPRTLSDLNL